MTGRLDERFYSIPKVEAAGSTQVSAAASATVDITESKVNVPNKPEAGQTYEIKLGGAKPDNNAAHKVHLKLGSTQVMSLEADDGTAVDWTAEFLIRFTDSKNQKIIGTMISNTTDGESDYAAGTVDCTAGAVLLVQIESAHANDTVTCEMVVVKSWVK